MDFIQLFLQSSYFVKSWLENDYIYFISVLFGVFLATKILIFIIEKFILIFTKKTKTDIDDKLIEASQNPVLILVMLFGFHKAIEPFMKSESFARTIDRLLISLGIFVITLLIIRVLDILVNAWADHFEKISKLDIKHDLLPLIHKMSKFVIFVFGIAFIMSAWNIDLGPILASLGVAGIVIGLAIQDSLSNVFSGISMIFDRAYKVGDIISLDSGESGVVYDIGLRSTKIRNWDNEILIVPNKKIANTVVKNVKQPDLSIKITILFGVEYGSSPDKVKEIVSSSINKIKTVSKEEGRETKVLFMSFGASSLDFKVMFWVDDIADKWDTHQEAMTRIYNALNKAKIGIPYPITTVYFNDETNKNLKK